MSSGEARAWFRSSAWEDFKKLWAAAFSKRPRSHAHLERRLGRLSRAFDPPAPIEEGLAPLHDRLKDRIESLRPQRKQPRGFHPHRPAPTPTERLAAWVTELEAFFPAARLLRQTQGDDAFLEGVVLPRIGIALQGVETCYHDRGVAEPQRQEAEAIAVAARGWLGPRHAVLPESRLALWPKSQAWAEFKRLYVFFDTADDEKTDLGKQLEVARDHWHSEMASALPTREGVAAQLYGALGSLYTWKMDSLSWSHDPRRSDSLKHHLARVGQGYRALWELRELGAKDPWITDVLQPSIDRALKELIEHIAVYRRAGGDANLLRRANEAVKSMQAHEKLGASGDSS